MSVVCALLCCARVQSGSQVKRGTRAGLLQELRVRPSLPVVESHAQTPSPLAQLSRTRRNLLARKTTSTHEKLE